MTLPNSTQGRRLSYFCQKANIFLVSDFLVSYVEDHSIRLLLLLETLVSHLYSRLILDQPIRYLFSELPINV